MATLEDRVTIVEAQTDKLAVAIEGVRKEVAAIRTDMATRADIAVIRTEIGALRTESGNKTDALGTELRSEMGALRKELREDITDLRADMRELSRRTDRLFIWVAGAQVATLVAVIGVLAGALFR